MSYRGEPRGAGGRGRGGGRERGSGYQQSPSSSSSHSYHGGGGGGRGRGYGGGGGSGGGDGRRGGLGGGGRGDTGRGGGGFSAPSQVLTPEIWLAASAEKLKLESPPTSSEPLRPPPRPGPGTIGTRCVVRANHFPVQLAERDLYHYDVSISPEVTSKSVCRDIINQLVEAYKQCLGNRLPAYDGKKSLYTAGPLPFLSKEFDVPLVDKDVDAGSQRKERKFKVTIKLANSRQFNVLQDKIQLLDIVLRAAKLSEE
ncbi:argonaute 5 [Ancistrocladus abbreviatus]